MIGRRRALALGASAIGGLPLLARQGRAAEFSLKWGSVLPSSHPVSKRCAEAVDRIRTESGGRLEIGFFPDAQLGGDADELAQARSGALDFNTVAGVSVSTLRPASSLINVPFAFKDRDQALRAVDGGLGKFISQAISSGTGLYAFERVWENGLRHVTNSVKPVVLPSDLKGLKIRVPASSLNVALFKALGAAPTSMNVTDLYSALQTKVVDAQENPLIQIASYRLFEVQKFCSLTSHLWDGFLHVANAESWRRLPSDLQELVVTSLDDAAMKQRADSLELSNALMKDLAEKGLAFNSLDLGLFRDALRSAGFYVDQRKRFGEGAWKILEEHAGPLG